MYVWVREYIHTLLSECVWDVESMRNGDKERDAYNECTFVSAYVCVRRCARAHVHSRYYDSNHRWRCSTVCRSRRGRNHLHKEIQVSTENNLLPVDITEPFKTLLSIMFSIVFRMHQET